MKKLLFIALLLTLASGSAIGQGQQGYGQGPGGHGQPGAGHGGSPGNPADRLTELLGLDEAQAAEIAAIFEQNQLLREEERERARLENCDIRANTHDQILAVLTPAQAELFEEHQANRDAMRRAFEEMRQERHGGNFGSGRGLQDCDG